MAGPSPNPPVHPHVPRFLRGFVIAAVVCGGAILLSRVFLAPADSSRDGVMALVESEQYAKAAEAIDALLEEADRNLGAGNEDQALGILQQARDSAHAARLLVVQRRAEAVRKDPAAQRLELPERAEYPFSMREADAAYLIAGVGYRQLRARYAEKFQQAVEGERFVPPVQEADAIRQEILAGLEANPDHIRLLHLQGVLDSMMGRFHAAEKAFLHAIELDRRFAEAYNDLGLVYLAREQFDKAEHSFENALIAAGEDKPAAKATALFNLGRFHAGLYENYAKEKGRDPASPDAKVMGEHRSKAIKSLHAFLEQTKADAPDAERARAVLARLESGE